MSLTSMTIMSVALQLILLCFLISTTITAVAEMEQHVQIDGASSSLPVAIFPLQFSAMLEVTSHLILDDSTYPPSKRSMTIFYDFIRGRARADLEKGYEAAKFYIRRYDRKHEYMVRLPPIDDCKRSYLGEPMPEPDLSEAIFQRSEHIDGTLCNYFLHVEHNVRCHIYLRASDNAPVQLRQESIMANGTIVPLLTYEYSDVFLGPQSDTWFELPAPHSHDSCVRHLGGFPYLHIFHYFVKF